VIALLLKRGNEMVMNNMLNGNFKTSDTPLAAYLALKGETYLGIEREDGRGYFVFAKSSTMEQNRLDWNEWNLCYRYYRQYRSLLKRLNE
jgi:hypothetical protein